MRLRNKKTGEIIDIKDALRDSYDYPNHYLISAEWEDYEEPKEYWFLSGRGEVKCIEDENTDFDKDHKYIGNYFETKEEAELAVRKLKAWKRLKDKGFRFVGRSIKDLTITYSFDNYDKSDIEQMNNDLDLLFGGEK